jgi:25S rRNA (adenine2142-N1)-methyltransferase
MATTNSRSNSSNKKKKKPVPLTKRPVIMKSRKRARQVTTQFHKLTHERERAVQKGDQDRVQQIDKELQAMGGRSEYQRASQLSTCFHSTSKWVLGYLARQGWLYGITIMEQSPLDSDHRHLQSGVTKRKSRPRRDTRILEVGAINTELLDAAAETIQSGESSGDTAACTTKYRLDVRSIDLHSMEARIEEADFLTLPFCSEDVTKRYDVIVCSMVINCVPTPADRGKMLARLFHHLRPGGLLFLTLPKSCLTRSAFMTMTVFEDMLGRSGGVGFDIVETKQSPKVAFFVCRRPESEEEPPQPLNKLWTKQTLRNKGKKFPNQFSIILDPGEVSG